MLAARLAGAAMVRIGQPRVMGEVLAGIALGPTLLGRVDPGLQAALFPIDVIPYVGAAANLGLIFYMFLIGLELDFSQLKGRVSQTAAISNAGVVLPMAVGLLVALPVYELVAPNVKFLGFALFMGVAMSITAFPVLARILVERRMLKRPVGAVALAAAASTTCRRGFSSRFASAVATASGASGVVRTIALAIVFCLAMAFLVRPLLSRVSVAYDEAGHVPGAWITAIFAGVLLSAYATETIGIALIFGAFIMGAIMPRRAELTEDVTRRIEDFVVMLLLPLFFAYTGLRTDVGLLDRPELVLLTLVLLAVAIFCKFGGAMLAARVTGLGLARVGGHRRADEHARPDRADRPEPRAREGRHLRGAVRGARAHGPGDDVHDGAAAAAPRPGEHVRRAAERGARGRAPGLDRRLAGTRARAVDPRRAAGRRGPRPAARAGRAAGPLRAAARGHPRPARGAARRLVGARRPADAGQAPQRGLDADGRARAGGCSTSGVAARAVALHLGAAGSRPGRARRAPRRSTSCCSTAAARCSARASRAGPSATCSPAPRATSPCSSRARTTRIGFGDDKPVIVPFGGAEHDWAALELGAWIAAANGAPLKLLGSAGTTDEGRDATRLLGNASLVVQQFAGIPAAPLIADPGPEGLIAAAGGAGLLVVGLSDRWRKEGLGATRSEIARSAPAPVLFVRRGLRPGALAPRGDVTRFTWSSPGHGPLLTGGG